MPVVPTSESQVYDASNGKLNLKDHGDEYRLSRW